VFYDANVDTSILLFQKIEPTQVTLIESPKPEEYHVVSVLSPDNLLKESIIKIKTYKNNRNASITETIAKNAERLSELSTVKSGLKAYATGKGNPAQTDEMKKNRIYHSMKKADKSYRPYLEGKDVKRYKIDWSGHYLKYGDNLAEPRKPELFKGERILVRQIPSLPPYSINASITDKNYINDMNSMIIVSPTKYSLKYLLGIINSKVITYWFDITFDKLQRGIFPQFKVNELSQFPIPQLDLSKKTDKDKHDKLVSLVEEINNQSLSLNEFDKINKQIDNTVYSLFGLNKVEITEIENALSEEGTN
jgi:hypothetical protein